MKLSPRMMAALAILDVLASAEGPKRIEDLGKLCGFRFKKTEQVVNLLRRGGVVESVRGVGCKLARPAESILLCEVFRAVDGEVFCVPETETGPGPSVARAFKTALEDKSQHHSLADVIRRHKGS